MINALNAQSYEKETVLAEIEKLRRCKGVKEIAEEK
jgi:hypothetical protein